MSSRERDLGSNPHSVTGLPDRREVLSKRMPFGLVIPGRRDSIPQNLGRKKVDYSRYMDRAGLTDRQRECFSLSNEYGYKQTDIARKLKLHHSTVQYHIKRAYDRIERSRRWSKKSKEGYSPFL